MKKLTKKQIATYPAFIARIDYKATGQSKACWRDGVKAVALKAKKITAALSQAEEMIDEQVYLIDVLQQIGYHNETGEPVYQAALRSRVFLNGFGELLPAEWHLPNKAHDEYGAMSCYIWLSNADGSGDLGYINIRDVGEVE